MLVVGFVLVLAAPTKAEPALADRIAEALSPLPHPQTAASAYIVNLKTNEVVFEHDADAPLIPASNAKVFVMGAALARFGPEFTFDTVLATDGNKLFLIGGGDPALGDEKLAKARGENGTSVFDRWAQAVVSSGKTSFPGGLVADETIFDGEYVHTSWEEEDLGKWYSAPVSGLNFANNCLEISVSPAAEEGRPCLVKINPATTRVDIVNRCISSKHADPILHHPAGTDRYFIRGRCRRDWPFPPVSYPQPPMLAADVLRNVLVEHGVQIPEEIRVEQARDDKGGIPSNLTVLAANRTPLADVLHRTGTDSQNLFAECLLKRLGFEAKTCEGALLPRGGWRNGAAEVLAILGNAGIHTQGLVIDDGSGLSRNNRCTARQLVEVHRWTRSLPGGEIFRDSLAEPGEQGSLRKRMRDASDSVHAKTGTMTGISTLSGFVSGADGSEYAFALMFNGYPGSSRPYKAIQDNVCRILAGIEP
ncbi:MAG: D-alanyl-D-alanine carboxypeptidase/D-alanyl-D-alanine-endopeptidase [Phycisphaerae bacterium]|nr:D-alanyl-D-alanine carboxypeptidase/D-alanyl-D-alanine-endopeptidase [Phycisphaerae bacterium]